MKFYLVFLLFNPGPLLPEVEGTMLWPYASKAECELEGWRHTSSQTVPKGVQRVAVCAGLVEPVSVAPLAPMRDIAH